MARLLDFPGGIEDALFRRELELEGPGLAAFQVVDEVRRSPRANAFLALEPRLRRVRIRRHVFGLSIFRSNVFVVGGIHGREDGMVEALVELRRWLASLGARRILIVPISEEERRPVEEAGFGAIQVAAEGLIEPASFDLSGGAMADLRQMHNRARRRFELDVVEVDPEHRADARRWQQTYHDWLRKRPGGREMGLLVGTPCMEEPLGRRYFATTQPRRDVFPAVLSLTPGWDGAGFGVDIMARDEAGPPGAMDLLLIESIRRLGDEGVKRFSLGSSPMAAVPGEKLIAPTHLRLLMTFLFESSLGQRIFGFRHLFRYKNKFRPRWQRIYLAGWPRMGFWSLYTGGRLWGLFSGVA